ncbi:MAG TPA: tetratricopeptide repeat protein, partial [Chloroflexia bacterium]|nr:tetratricopeptide repeat protein [Chloroflexia bacterium]
RDLTQEELADRIGCSPWAIQKIEVGSRRPSRQMVELLAEYFAVPDEESAAFMQFARGHLPTWPASEAGASAPTTPAVPAHPGNLPVQVTSFVGRTVEVARLSDLLLGRHSRLITLTGPPGIGKTRLALHTASQVQDRFADGAYFVDLAPITDPSLVLPEIVRTLGLRETGDRPLLDILAEHLRDRQMLLVLDNFEQVMPAAGALAHLVQSAPGLALLVTSRELLRLRGEKDFPVPPLSLPDLQYAPPPDRATRYEAVRLFVDRAADARDKFELTAENAPAVFEICCRLDGLPLAIELAATRTRLFTPQALLARLQDRLKLLTGGARDLPARQQTLRTAIEWSYDLLDPPEQRLLRRLAVFQGGRTLEAIEAVCDTEDDLEIDVVEGVSSLVDKSLLVVREGVGGDLRYIMLETIQEYAREKLEESGEAEALRQQHAQYFLAFVERLTPYLLGSDQAAWLARIGDDYDNIRAALQWSLGVEDATIGLRIVIALHRFWNTRSDLHEGRAWIAAVLARQHTQTPENTLLRAKAMVMEGNLAYLQSDYATAESLYAQGLEVFREVGDRAAIADALDGLGEIATERGDYITAIVLLEEAIALSRELGDTRGVADMLIQFGWAAMRTGDYDTARLRLEESLGIHRRLGDTARVAMALAGLGEAAVRQGDFDRAAALLEESLAARRALGQKWGVATTLGTMAWSAMLKGDNRGAVDLLAESVIIRREIGDKGGVAWCLERLAEVAHSLSMPARAATLYGAAAALRATIGSVVDPADQAEHDLRVAAVREQMSEEEWRQRTGEGRAMTFEEAVEYALQGE